MNREIHNLLKIENDKTTIFTNKELKMIDDYINGLEAYKYNLDRDYLRLEKENNYDNVFGLQREYTLEDYFNKKKNCESFSLFNYCPYCGEKNELKESGE